MKKFAKVMAVMLCAVLLVCGSIFGTLAYLTFETETLTNTFTFGDVSISLTEAVVGSDGQKIPGDDGRVTSQQYKLIPGVRYDKDPLIHINAGSENTYLFVKVENGIEKLEAGYIEPSLDVITDDPSTTKCPTVKKQMEYYGWNLLDGTTNIYYYDITPDDGHKGDATLATHDYQVFTHVYISSKVEDFSNHGGENYAGAKIMLTAYAVQTAGFTDVTDAWAKTFGAPNP